MAGFWFNALWLLLALPGFALLRRVRHPWLEHGVLAAISGSYVATFVLFTPVAIVGYWLHVPVRVVGIAFVVLIAAALVELTLHARQLGAKLTRPTLPGMIVLLLLAADYWASTRAGTYPLGDAHYHMGRIRVLMDHGLVNWDPFTPGRHFDPVYHSNVYHAAIAAISQLTGLPAFEGWSRMLPVTKILVAGSAEALAFALFRSRVLAVCAAGAAVVAWSALRIQPYPNQLAAAWLLPLAMGSALDLLDGERPVRAALGIGATALVLAQLHALYYTFECVLLGPLLSGVALFALARKRSRAWLRPAVLGLLALGVGLPWLGRSAMERGLDLTPPAVVAPEHEAAPATEAEDDDAPAEEAVPLDWRYRGFLVLDDHQLALDPGSLADPRNTRVHLLLALALAALSRRPRRIAAFVAMIAVAYLMLHAPEICTLAVRVAGAPWIVKRLDAVITISALVAVPCVVGFWLLERGWLRGPAPYAVFALCLGYAYAFGTDDGLWTRAEYVARVREPARLQRELARQARRAELLARYVPEGALLATSLARAVEIPEVCDCFPFALPVEKGNHGVADMDARRSALLMILSPGIPNQLRAPLLRYYGVRHIFLGVTRTSKKLQRKVKPLTVAGGRTPAGLLLVLDGTRPFPEE